jgi:LacI family transcriptional regulator
MGYVPDIVARGLRNRSSQLFGLVIPATTHPMFGRLLLALEEQAHQLGFEIVLAHSLNQPDREEMVIRRLLARRVDGLFLCPVYRLEPTASIYQELHRSGLPTVLLGHRASFCDQFVNVETDDATASYTATRHLIELGHKQIAFLAGSPASPSAKERLSGYRRALQESGVEPNDQLLFKAGSTIQEGEQAAQQVLQEQAQITAIQANNDLVAVGAANVLLNQGCQIPRDLSVVGFGNTLVSEYFRIPLTTIREPKFSLGMTAMDLMARLLRGERPSSRRLPADLVVRSSTAPAPTPQPAPRDKAK